MMDNALGTTSLWIFFNSVRLGGNLRRRPVRVLIISVQVSPIVVSALLRILCRYTDPM